MNQREMAHLTLAVEDAKDQADAERKDLREQYAHKVEAEPEPTRDDETPEARPEGPRLWVNNLCDKRRQLLVVQAVIEKDCCDHLLSDLEIRARHDLPGSQYVARSLTEQAQAEAREALDRRVETLQAEIQDLKDKLDAWEPPEPEEEEAEGAETE